MWHKLWPHGLGTSAIESFGSISTVGQSTDPAGTRTTGTTGGRLSILFEQFLFDVRFFSTIIFNFSIVSVLGGLQFVCISVV